MPGPVPAKATARPGNGQNAASAPPPDLRNAPIPSGHLNRRHTARREATTCGIDSPLRAVWQSPRRRVLGRLVLFIDLQEAVEIDKRAPLARRPLTYGD
jgi:hypothetical protein